jgi:hypothetical protein
MLARDSRLRVSQARIRFIGANAELDASLDLPATLDVIAVNFRQLLNEILAEIAAIDPYKHGGNDVVR